MSKSAVISIAENIHTAWGLGTDGKLVIRDENEDVFCIYFIFALVLLVNIGL